MQTSNGNQNIKPENPVWHLLAEFSLSEMMSDNVKGDQLRPGFLFHPFQELGIPPEWIENIKMTLTGFAKEALSPFKRGKLDLPGSIRIFCQKEAINDAVIAKTTRSYDAEQTMELAPIIDHPGTIMNRGWGYFIIERFGGSAGSSEGSLSFFDLYLYKEGE